MWHVQLSGRGVGGRGVTANTELCKGAVELLVEVNMYVLNLSRKFPK